jgi:hypothetical protein
VHCPRVINLLTVEDAALSEIESVQWFFHFRTAVDHRFEPTVPLRRNRTRSTVTPLQHTLWMPGRIDPDDAAKVMLEAGLEPLTEYPKAGKPWRCRCMKCGKEVAPTYGSVKNMGVRCAYCSGTRVDPEDAAAVMREAGLEPLEPYQNATGKWRCKCLVCGEESTPTYHAVKSSHAKCKFCARAEAGRKVRVPAEAAERVMRDAGYEPLEPYQLSHTQWRCRCLTCGKESTPTYDNAKSGYGCIHCGRERTVEASRNDPIEAAAFMRSNGFEPIDEYPGAGNTWKVKCLACGHVVSPTYASVRKGSGCRYCKRRCIDPEHAASDMRAAGVEPHGAYISAITPWPSTCLTCEREVSPTYRWVMSSGRGCKYCSTAKRAAERRKDPELAARFMEAHGFTPLVEYLGAAEKWRCRCNECERESTPTYSGVQQGHGCVLCARDRTAARIRLDPAGPTAAMRAAGLEPIVDYPGAGVAWLCECMTCGNEVSPRYNSIKQGQGGCMHCVGKIVTPGAARLAVQRAGFEPLVEFAGSKVPWLCCCTTCDRSLEITYSAIKSGNGCRLCYEDRRGESLRLDPLEAEAAMRAAGLEPQEPYSESGRPWSCICQSCGERVTPSLTSIRAGHGCRRCAAKKRGAASRRTEESAIEIMELAGFEPLEPYRSANTPWRSKCRDCRNVVTPAFSHIKDGGGCRYCSKTGFDFTKPGKLYVMTHREFDSVKVGIAAVAPTRKDGDRIRQHALHGWVLFKSHNFGTGNDAYRVEQSVLRHLRAAGFPQHLTKELMPQSGATETFNRDQISEAAVWDAVMEKIADLREDRQVHSGAG